MRILKRALFLLVKLVAAFTALVVCLSLVFYCIGLRARAQSSQNNFTPAVGTIVTGVASVVNAAFNTNWIEASAQTGADIETQISNACTALSAKGGGGGFITISFTGTQTGALGSNPFANCPDSSTPGNGTLIFVFSPPNGTILTSAPWLLPNKARIYGAFGWLERSWTTIKAGSAFKTMANLRKATLAQTTGLVRTGSGPYTVTATFTNTPAGTGCGGSGCGLEFTAGEPIQIGCSTNGDQSFVGIWLVQTANSTSVTYTQNTPFPWQGAYSAVGNVNGTCIITGGTPVIGLTENGKDYSAQWVSATLTPYGNPQTQSCTTIYQGSANGCYGSAGAAFGGGVFGLTIDCDDLSPATGCVGLRNVYSQEKTFVNDVSIINFNFIGLVLDNMNSSGLQNSGPYENMELYVSPLADGHADNCSPTNLNDTTSNNNPIPVEGIFANGLSIRAVYAWTMTMVPCGTHSTNNYNPGMVAAEFSQTGNVELGTGGTIHCEKWLTCLAIGLNGPASGGTTIVGMGGAPVSNTFTCTGGCALGTTYSPFAILISSNYTGTSDVTILNVRRNAGMTSSLINQFTGDNLNGAADAVDAIYAWDVQGANYPTFTTSVTVPSRMQGLQLNRLFTMGNSAPSVACTGVGTGSCAVLSNSSDSIGAVQLTVAGGTGAATGVVTLTFTSAMGAHVGSCVWTLSQAGSGQWLTGATPASVFDNGGGSTTAAKAVWYDQATGLANGTYNLNYFCGGHN